MDGGQKVEQLHGDVAEEDPGRRQRSMVDEADGDEKAPRRSKRVASLDVFRGLTVAVSDCFPSTPLSGYLMVAKFSELTDNCKSEFERWCPKCSILSPLVVVSN
jgi:hypothetical protein